MGRKLIGEEKGIAMVELAIVLPILLFVIFGIIEFALIMFDKAVITHASREGARAGVVFRADSHTGDYSPMIVPDIETVVNPILEHLITFSDAQAQKEITLCPADLNAPPPRQITVTVTYPYAFLLLPNFDQDGFLAGINPMNLTAVAVMRCE